MKINEKQTTYLIWNLESIFSDLRVIWSLLFSPSNGFFIKHKHGVCKITETYFFFSRKEKDYEIQ